LRPEETGEAAEVPPPSEDGEQSQTKEPVYRFPVVQPATAEFTVTLPSFADAPDGFRGSLDHLLQALRTEKISLTHLPLAPVVDQYLAFCQHLTEEDPSERVSDFLPLAATLIHLKSRLFLRPEDASGGNQPTVAAEVVEEIERQERRRREEQARWEGPIESEDRPSRLTLLDLLLLLREVQSSRRTPPVVVEEGWSVRQAIRWVRDSLPANQALQADTYFEQCETRREQATVFLALLELGRNHVLDCYQAEAFAPLWICTRAEPDASLARPLPATSARV
jgi:segregation and condensation protein A